MRSTGMFAARDAVGICNAMFRNPSLRKSPANAPRVGIVDLNLKMPRRAAAEPLYNHRHQDWRDVLPRIKLPTLFVCGSLVVR